VDFPDPPLVNLADLVVFRFQLAPYMHHAGHADQAPKVAVTSHTDDYGGTTVCGQVYSISRRRALNTPLKGSQRWSWSVALFAPTAKHAATPRTAKAARWERVPIKQRDYGAELDDYLERALESGAPPPTAADVLREWAEHPPHGIEVASNGRTFTYSSGGNQATKQAGTSALTKAINRRVRILGSR
jgi:hypothetical protein